MGILRQAQKENQWATSVGRKISAPLKPTTRVAMQQQRQRGQETEQDEGDLDEVQYPGMMPYRQGWLEY